MNISPAKIVANKEVLPMVFQNLEMSEMKNTQVWIAIEIHVFKMLRNTFFDNTTVSFSPFSSMHLTGGTGDVPAFTDHFTAEIYNPRVFLSNPFFLYL